MHWKQEVLYMAKVLDQCIASNGTDMPSGITDVLSVNDFNMVPQRMGWFVLKLNVNAVQPHPPPNTKWGLRSAPLDSYAERPDCIIHRLRLEGRLECRRVCLKTDPTWCMAYVQDAAGIDLNVLDGDDIISGNTYCVIHAGDMAALPNVLEEYVKQYVGRDVHGRLGFYHVESWKQAFPTAVMNGNEIDNTQLHAMHVAAIQEMAVLLHNAHVEIYKLKQRLE